MIQGSVSPCLLDQNGARGPSCTWTPANAEAYHSSTTCGAACIPDPLQYMIRCHRIHWDPTFLSEPAALGQAINLRTEVLATNPELLQFQSTASTMASLQSSLR